MHSKHLSMCSCRAAPLATTATSSCSSPSTAARSVCNASSTPRATFPQRASLPPTPPRRSNTCPCRPCCNTSNKRSSPPAFQSTSASRTTLTKSWLTPTATWIACR
eukprot:Gregarina_sp_Pseudo_9__1639@NODE_2100_length_1150_cov_12_534653_g1938_i0_p4_GENE_NODE_2100_length_1150_cov_12_534653_g1938_i0NODE_2100_length_1150_cov_12_534653_g1938_i0_p4_ORF_typecomplete_len106_score24_39DUF4357/PF14267_6/2_2_NODE_2100_length_1150_cov_12_534653_g1938_i0358675